MTEKRKINIGANKGKMGKAPPEWILNLKNGLYTVKELMASSKKTDSSVKKIMAKYAIKITYIVQENGRASARYHWDHAHFLKLFYGDKNEEK